MKLTPVIAALRARCPVFENRVAGAAQFKDLPEVGKMKLPSAYVVPGDDSPGEQKSQTDYWQTLREGFSVIVFVSNGRDERGQFASFDVVHEIRQMLFKALLGGKPGATITRYNNGPFKCTSSCVDATYSTEWRYYWQVNMPASTDATWMTCKDNCETPVRYWGDTVAECVINKLCPSHTYVIFKYP